MKIPVILLILVILINSVKAQTLERTVKNVRIIYDKELQSLNGIDSLIQSFKENELLPSEVSVSESFYFGSRSDFSIIVNELLRDNIDIVIGPSKSSHLLEINRILSGITNKELPYFIAPNISTPSVIYDNLYKFVNSTATNEDRVKSLYNIISRYNLDEIGIFYESDEWGIDLFENFDLELDGKVMGKPVPKSINDIRAIDSFIQRLSEKDVRLVVLAPLQSSMLNAFLERLHIYNNGSLMKEYRPIILNFNDYEIYNKERNIELINNIHIYGVSEKSDFSKAQLTEENSNNFDAFLLIAHILSNDTNFENLISHYVDFHAEDNVLNDFDLDDDSYVTKYYKNRRTPSIGARLNLYKVKLEGDSTIIKSISANDSMSFWGTRILPFYNFHPFPRRLDLLALFILSCFFSFTYLIQKEYYTPIKLLLKSKAFWFWFISFMVITAVIMSALLFWGYIRSDQILIVFLAGLICPFILDFLLKKISMFTDLPGQRLIFNSINNIKEGIDIAFSKMIPEGDFDALIDYLDKNSTFYKVRMTVYNSILAMRSSTLVKRFATDLKNLLEELDQVFDDQGLPENDREQLRKRRLIKFYLELLHLTSRDTKTFKKRLLNGGIGNKGSIKNLIQPPTSKMKNNGAAID